MEWADEALAASISAASGAVRASSQVASAAVGLGGMVGRGAVRGAGHALRFVAPSIGADLPSQVKAVGSAAAGTADVAAMAVKAGWSLVADVGSVLGSAVGSAAAAVVGPTDPNGKPWKSVAASRQLAADVADSASSLLNETAKVAEETFQEIESEAAMLMKHSLGENAAQLTRDLVRASKVASDTLASAHGVSTEKLAKQMAKAAAKSVGKHQ